MTPRHTSITSHYISSFWVENSSSVERNFFIVFPWPTLDSISIFRNPDLAGEPKDIEQMFAYRLIDQNTQPILYRKPIFPIKLAPNERSKFMVAVYGDGSLQLGIELWEPSDFWLYEVKEGGLHLFFIGMVFVMFLYNLILAISTAYREYYLYSVYVGFNLLLQISLTGFGKAFLFFENDWLLDNGQMTFAAAACVSGGLFLMKILSVDQLSKPLYRISSVVIGFWSVIFILSFFFSEAALAIFHVPMSCFSFVFVLYAVCYSCYKGNPLAPAVLIAWIILLLGGVVFTLNVAGLIPSSWFTVYALEAGVAMEVSLLSLVLAKRAKQEKQQYLQESNRLKDEFMGTISHELRTPMNGIAGNIELLKTTQLDSEQSNYLRAAYQSTNNMQGLVEDLLIYSEACSKTLAANNVPLRLRELVVKTILYYQDLSAAKGLSLNLEYDKNIPYLLLGDASKVVQIIRCLVENSVKYTQSGSIDVGFSLLSSSQTAGDVIRLGITVKDTGIGIAEDKQKDIFAYFSQVDGSYRRKFGGLGIGLAICDELVRVLKGTISLTSSVGRGSCFKVELPLVIAETKNNDESKDIESNGFDPSKFVVLVVEDNPVNQKLLLGMLKKIGYAVLKADDGLIALEVVENNHVDFILMDCQMPNMDGFEATKKIRAMQENKKHVPIVAVTANATSQDREKCLEFGMNGYLKKPVRMQAIKETLHEWLAKAS